MKSIIIKEFRENILWAGLLMLGMAVALGWTVYDTSRYSPNASIVEAPFQATTVIGTAAAGLILGLLQSLADQWRGRWAFVLHRPVSRRSIFLGKAVAGLLLYAIATAIPFALTVVWIATPGNVAMPFDWHMILPGSADILAGVMWYFTGLLVGWRQARWSGSRIMPIGLSVAITTIAGIMMLNFVEAAIVIGVGIILFAALARSSFVHVESPQRQPIVVRIVLTLACAAGIIGLVLMADAFVQEVFRTLTPTSRALSYTVYQLDQRGTIYGIEYGDRGKTRVRDLAGKEYTFEEALNEHRAMRMIGLSSNVSQEQLSWADRRAQNSYRLPPRYIRQMLSHGNISWYYVPARQSIEGFESVTRQRVGSIGPSGFAMSGAAPEPFKQPMQVRSYRSGMIAYDKTTIYQINLESSSIKKAFSTSPDDPIVDAGPTDGFELSDHGEKPVPIQLMVMTKNAFRVVDAGQVVLQVPNEFSDKDSGQVNLGRAGNGHIFMQYFKNRFNLGDQKQWVTELDENGKQIARTDLPPTVFVFPPPPVVQGVLELIPLPPAFLALATFSGETPPQGVMVMSIVMGTTCVLCGLIAIWLMRGTGWSGATKTTWSVIALLLGISGVLLLLAMRSFPHRVRCPFCKALRPVDQDACPACGHQFEAPKMEGIEIFTAADARG